MNFCTVYVFLCSYNIEQCFILNSYIVRWIIYNVVSRVAWILVKVHSWKEVVILLLYCALRQDLKEIIYWNKSNVPTWCFPDAVKYAGWDNDTLKREYILKSIMKEKLERKSLGQSIIKYFPVVHFDIYLCNSYYAGC